MNIFLPTELVVHVNDLLSEMDKEPREPEVVLEPLINKSEKVYIVHVVAVAVYNINSEKLVEKAVLLLVVHGYMNRFLVG